MNKLNTVSPVLTCDHDWRFVTRRLVNVYGIGLDGRPMRPDCEMRNVYVCRKCDVEIIVKGEPR